MTKMILVYLLVLSSTSAHAWISGDATATADIVARATSAYQKAADAKTEKWAKDRAAKIQEAGDTYGGKFTGTEITVTEIGRDESGEVVQGTDDYVFGVSYTFIITEKTLGGVHREKIVEPAAAVIMDCEVSAIMKPGPLTTINNMDCKIKPSSLLTEIAK